jgi:putative NADH-flavin reductase
VKFFVLGATGTTGGLFTDEALASGHEVSAYARNPQKLTARKCLTVIAGDVLDPGAMAEERTGTSRVLIMSAFGVGESLPKASRLARLMYSSGGKAIYADKAAGGENPHHLRPGLDWTLAYPVLLTNNPKSSAFTAIDLADLRHLPGLPRVSRADVAGFLLDAATKSAWSRRTAVLTTGNPQ